MKSAQRVTGDRPLTDIGCRYIFQKLLGFIATERDGSTVTVIPYLTWYSENYCNVSTSLIICTHINGRYFSTCDEIYNHNIMR